MGIEAGIDEGVLHRLRIEHRELSSTLLEREDLRRGMVRSRLAKGGIVEPAHRRGQPHSAFFVYHRVVVVDARVPNLPVAPIGRRHDRLLGRRVPLAQGRWHFGIAHRRMEVRDRVRRRVEDRQLISGIERPIGIDRRIAPIGRDQVVEVLVRLPPVPFRNDDIAFDTLRARRLLAR